MLWISAVWWTQGTAVQINTAHDLVALLDTPQAGTTITLGGDITFDEATLASLPLGSAGAGCVGFSGSLEGNNHTISGLVLNKGSGGAGLFCRLEGATVSNLFFDSSCSVHGGNAGVLAVSVQGDVELTNVHSQARVTCTGTSCGGLVAHAPAVHKVVLHNCTNSGPVKGNSTHVGGLVGFVHSLYSPRNTNMRNTGRVECTNCVGANVGGLIGTVGPQNIIQVYNSSNFGPVSNMHCTEDCDSGGIVAFVSEDTSFTLDGVLNNGHIQCKGTGTKPPSLVKAGGIVGSFHESLPLTRSAIIGSTNKGSVDSTGLACGIGCVLNVHVQDTVSLGAVTGTQTQHHNQQPH